MCNHGLFNGLINYLVRYPQVSSNNWKSTPKKSVSDRENIELREKTIQQSRSLIPKGNPTATSGWMCGTHFVSNHHLQTNELSPM